MTAEEVGDFLCVCTTWVYAEARAGRIPHVRIGRYVRFRRESVEEWALRLERGPRSA
jgi:excisionase family DNA binding protein